MKGNKPDCNGYEIRTNGNCLKNVRYKGYRHFRNKKSEYLEVKIGELATY
jgi:hypothetical protein